MTSRACSYPSPSATIRTRNCSSRTTAARTAGRTANSLPLWAGPSGDAQPRTLPPAPPLPPGPEAEEGEDNLARVTLRIPESVKLKAEIKAAEAGQSLNTWLVNIVRAATSDHAINVDIDLSSLAFLENFDPFKGKGKPGSKRMTGWL